jgi:hypothetical protein
MKGTKRDEQTKGTKKIPKRETNKTQENNRGYRMSDNTTEERSLGYLDETGRGGEFRCGLVFGFFAIP